MTPDEKRNELQCLIKAIDGDGNSYPSDNLDDGSRNPDTHCEGMK